MNFITSKQVSTVLVYMLVAITINAFFFRHGYALSEVITRVGAFIVSIHLR